MPQPQLAQIGEAFAAEFPVRLLPPSGDTPLGQLAVGLHPDAQGRERILTLTLQPPLDPEDAGDCYSLQFFTPLPFAAAPAHRHALAWVLLHLNATLPLVGFGLAGLDENIHFRCILPVAPDRELSSSECLYTAWLVYSCVDRFSDILEAVAMGRMTDTEAVIALESGPAETED